VDKFHYLNSLLEGTALKSVEGLTLTERNYNVAVGMLKERFGDPQKIISSHMEKLLIAQATAAVPSVQFTARS